MGYPAIGQPAPAIEVSAWISGKPEQENGLSKKNVILEFWGTHCGPCIAAIPHLNELVATYGSKDLLFVSLTREEPHIVERFLEKRPIKGGVATDREGATFAAYGIRGIPHTFLIDSQGLLRWHGHPVFLTAELLEEFLQTDKVPKVVEETTSAKTAPEVTPDTLFFLKIDRSAANPDRKGASLGRGDNQFEAEFYEYQVVDVIRVLLDCPHSRTRIEGKEPEELLDVELRSFHPMPAKAAREKAVDVLCDMFGIEIYRVVEQREGWTLTCPNPQLTDMSDLGGGSSMGGFKGQFTGSNITIDQLTDRLEGSLKRVFFNETHLAGKYDFVLPFETFAQTRRALEEEYGIKVESVLRDVEIVILRMADAAIGGSEDSPPRRAS